MQRRQAAGMIGPGTKLTSASGFNDLASELDAATLRDLLIDINLIVPDSASVALMYLARNNPEVLGKPALQENVKDSKGRGRASKAQVVTSSQPLARSFSHEELHLRSILPENVGSVISPVTMTAPKVFSSSTSSSAPVEGKDTLRRKKKSSIAIAPNAGGHSFVVAKLKSATCLLCDKPIKVGMMKAKGMECSVCGTTIHQKCKGTTELPDCARGSEVDIGNYC